MAPGHPADALAMVLVGTSHPGNIGAAARAMKTMGLSRLCLVAAECDPFHPDAWAMSAGADDLITAAWQGPSLGDALADCSLVFGATARRRSVPLPEMAPRAAAEAALAEVARGGRVAMLFGRERTGLDNDELQRCHVAIHIPTDPAFASLNLAAAVQVQAYELRIAMLATQRPEAPAEPRDPPASHALMEGLFDHLDRTLHAIDFHKGRAPDTVMQRLRRLFLRAAPDEREVRILRGIFTDAERMARLAQDSRRQ